MHPVARNEFTTLNRRCKIRILVRDISGPEGRPWHGLEQTPLKLIWNIARGENVLSRGEVNDQGEIVAKLSPGSGPVTLRIGPPPGEQTGVQPPEEPVSAPECEFAWCEQYELEQVEEVLPPVTEIEGVQARLNRLGYHAGLVDGDLGPVASSALMSFQQEHGLVATGMIDAETQEKLLEEMEELDAGA